MKTVPFGQASYSPEPGKALIIFLHPPSSHRGRKRPAVFDISSEDDNKLVGIIPSKTKVAYQAQPGDNIFMVVSFGDKANFMKANLEEGKTYYALIKRVSSSLSSAITIKIGFVLQPIHKEKLDSEKFSNWFEKCEYVENTDKSYKWAKDNAQSIKAKK